MAERSVTFIPEVDVQIGNAPVEGELEGFEEILEHAEKGDQPISQPAELKNVEPQPKEPSTLGNEDQQAPASTKPEVITEEDTGGQGK